MDKTFLMENLWNIFEVAREERTDGDNFQGDMTTADSLFLNGLTEQGKRYQCMEKLDKPALLEQWKSEDQARAKAAYRAVVNSDLDHLSARRYKELCEAFSTGDRDAFERIVAAAVEELETSAEGESEAAE